MTDIKIWKVDESRGLTNTEIRNEYERMAAKSKFSKNLFMSLADMTINGVAPHPIADVSILTLRVKSMLDYCLPVFDGKREGVWLQSEYDMRGINLNFREAVVSRDTKYKTIGVYTQYRKSHGATVYRANGSSLLRWNTDDAVSSGNYSIFHPDGWLMGSAITPLPFPASAIVPVDDNKTLLSIISEINHTIAWYLRHQYLIYDEISSRFTDKDTGVPIFRVQTEAKRMMPSRQTPLDPKIATLEKLTYARFGRNGIVLTSDLYTTGTSIIREFGAIRGWNDKGTEHAISDAAALHLSRQTIAKHRVQSIHETTELAVHQYFSNRLYGASYTSLPSESARRQVDTASSQWIAKVYNRSNQIDPNRRLIGVLSKTIQSGNIPKLRAVWAQVCEVFDIQGAQHAPRASPPGTPTASKSSRSSTKRHEYTELIPPRVPFVPAAGGGVKKSATDAKRVAKTKEKSADGEAGKKAKQDVHKAPADTSGERGAKHAERAEPPVGILCPHYIDLVERTLELGNIDTAAQEAATKWAGDVQVDYHYYCKLCSELLYIDDLTDFIIFGRQTIVSNTGEWDPLKIKIYSEVLQACRSIKFKTPRNIKSLATAISNILEPELTKIQDKLQQSKTKSIDEINLMVVLYISIYAYAFLAKMIIEGRGKVEWNVRTQQRVGTRPNEVIAVALAIISTTKASLISRINEFGSEQIKSVLISAFAYVNKLQFSDVSNGEEELDDIPHLLMHEMRADPVLCFGSVIYTLEHGGKRMDPHRLVKLEQLQSSHPYQSLRPQGAPVASRLSPPGTPKAKRGDKSAAAEKGASSETADGETPGDRTKAERGYMGSTAASRLETPWRQLLEYVEDIVPKRYNEIPPEPVVVEWRKKWADLHKRDAERYREVYLEKLRPSVVMYRLTRPTDTVESVGLSDIKCPDGRRHDYSLDGTVWVYKTGRGERKLKTREIIDAKRSGEWSESNTLVGEECGRCGWRAGSPPRDISKSIASAVAMKNFFNYFENRCPGAPHDFHDLAASGACKICGFNRAARQEEKEKWYNKWRASMPEQTSIRIEHKPPPVPERPAVPKKTDAWNITLASILQISKISEIPYNVWINLGLTERYVWSDIQRGRINPQSNLDDSDVAARCEKLLGYIQYIRTVYNLVHNHKNAVVPHAIRALLEFEPAGQWRLNDILFDFDRTSVYYRDTLPPGVYANYLLHTICDTLLRIRTTDNTAKKFAHKFFTHLCKSIINSERLLSKVDVRAKYIAPTQVDVDPENPEQIDPDATQMGPVGQDDGEPSDPFTLDDVDIETSNTGQDDEEFMD